MTLRRTAFWCGVGLAALLGVAASTVALAVYRPQLVRPWVQRALTPRGGTASLAGMKISLTPPSFELSGLTIAGPPREGDLLRLDHLKFELIPGRFFHGGPWLRHVEVRGLVFERRRPRDTTGPPDLTPLTRLFDLEDLSLSDVRLRVALPQGDLAADGVHMSLTPGNGGIRVFSGYGELTFRRKESTLAEGNISARGYVTPGPAIAVDLKLASGRLILPWLAGDVFGRTRLRVTPKNIEAEEVTLTLPQGQVTLGPQATENLGPIRLSAAASATLEGREPRLEVRGLDIGGLLLARGGLHGSTPDAMSGTFDGEILRVERVKAVLSPLLPDSMAGMELKGKLPYRLALSVRGTTRMLALDLLPRDLLFSWTTAGLDCRFGGSLRAEGTILGWLHGKARLAGRIRGTGHLERPPLAVRLFRFDAPLAGEIAAPTLPGWMLSAGAGEVTYGGRSLPLGTLELRGTARASDHSYRVEGVEIQSGSLGHLTGELSFHGGSFSGLLNGTGLSADNMVSFARAWSGGKWNIGSTTGAIEVAARIEPAEGGPRVAATVSLGQIGFTSPAGDVMGRNLAGRVGLVALLASRPRVKADLVLRHGEALWGTVYVDLAKDPLELHAGGTRVGPEEYEDLVLEGGWGGYGRLSIEGKARHAGKTWRHQGRIALRDARLGPIFRTFLRDPLAASHPDLADLETEGAIGIDLSFSGSGKVADLEGTFRLRSGDVRRGAGPPLLSGLDIDLPVSYSLGAENPGRARPSDAGRWGRFRLKSVRLGDQELGPLDMPAVLVPNHLYLGGSVEASLFGARLALRRLQVDEPLSPGFLVRMAAELGDLDLSRVAGKSPTLEGRLGGLLDPVTLGRERMTADGTLTGDLFGGRLDVARVTLERPFSAGREIGADVNVDRIDLERLSGALGVGRITGRLSGSIKGLRVSYGQPVAFDLTMESVPAEGVSQSVSLKAVNSISLIGTGSALSGMGVSLMARFFREFPYEKIGFECRLKNDVFAVRGLIHRDGVEYLVKRRFFTGIDVINGNPDNRIGFSDMLERAKRVTGERSD